MSDKLTMQRFLVTVVAEGVFAREKLIDEGYHPNVVLAKAEKAARKGYYQYGVVADRGWVTDNGFDYTLEHVNDN